MQAPPQPLTPAEMPLQLLLFVDKRPSSREQSRQVQNTLRALRAEYAFELQVIDVGEQPYLAEHFRLVATPALLKIQPEPRQTLAGSNIVAQVEHWWPYWKRSAEDAAGRQEPESTLGELELVPEVLDQPSHEAGSVSDSAPDRSISDKVESVEPGQLARTASAGSIARSAELIQLSDEVFQLKRDKEELEHQLKFKDQIIAMLAHDLRNPLTAASIALETLEMGHHAKQGWTSKLSPTLTAQLLKHARSQIRSLDHMITDILQAARGASSELRIQPQKLDLGDLCLDVLGTFQDRFQAKLQQVEKDIPSDLPTVLADGERVRQVLTNLLDNAIKYTPVEGTIEVSILHRTTQKIQVSICDNGPGIPEENRERIFEDRFRLKRDEAQEGYGIGLSLCQRIIRAHYGQIWVDSIGNHGSCFHFTLPVFRA